MNIVDFIATILFLSRAIHSYLKITHTQISHAMHICHLLPSLAFYFQKSLFFLFYNRLLLTLLSHGSFPPGLKAYLNQDTINVSGKLAHVDFKLLKNDV